MTRREYDAIATVIRGRYEVAKRCYNTASPGAASLEAGARKQQTELIAWDLGTIFEALDPKFSKGLFLKECLGFIPYERAQEKPASTAFGQAMQRAINKY